MLVIVKTPFKTIALTLTALLSLSLSSCANTGGAEEDEARGTLSSTAEATASSTLTAAPTTKASPPETAPPLAAELSYNGFTNSQLEIEISDEVRTDEYGSFKTLELADTSPLRSFDPRLVQPSGAELDYTNIQLDSAQSFVMDFIVNEYVNSELLYSATTDTTAKWITESIGLISEDWIMDLGFTMSKANSPEDVYIISAWNSAKDITPLDYTLGYERAIIKTLKVASVSSLEDSLLFTLELDYALPGVDNQSGETVLLANTSTVQFSVEFDEYGSPLINGADRNLISEEVLPLSLPR